MHVVYHANGVVDAHLVKGALEHAGIPAFVNGDNLVGGVFGQSPAWEPRTVSVPDACVEDAGPVVRAIVESLCIPMDDGEAASAPASVAASRPRRPASPLRVSPASA